MRDMRGLFSERCATVCKLICFLATPSNADGLCSSSDPAVLVCSGVWGLLSFIGLIVWVRWQAFTHPAAMSQCRLTCCASSLTQERRKNSAFEECRRARRAKSNDDTQGDCVGLRAGGGRDHAQSQAHHAAGPAAPRSGARHQPPATAPGRTGAAIGIGQLS
jgi:hypothetical protein